MLKNFSTRLPRASRWLPVALLPLLPFAAQAQTPGYSPGTTANVAGTFTSIAATGTAIATANTDDANSAATPIGFTFTYNGTAFTDFVLNTNGFIRLGAAAPSSASLFYTAPQTLTAGPIASTDPADVNLIMPFAVDLTAGSVAGTSYQVATTGAAGSRVTTIQWTNVQDKVSTIATQYLNLSFQAKLYESGQIEFVYGPTVPNTTGSDFRYVAVGIKGSTAAASITATKGSLTPWSGATFAAGNYTGNTHNIRQTVTADAGRTYRFIPRDNDVTVSPVQTLTKLPIPQGAPHVVRATVANSGRNAQTNVQVTLTVTGANAFTNVQTIASLPVGGSATVSFAPFTPTSGGNNTVTVSTLADDNNADNTQSVIQLVNASQFSYSDATAPTSARGFGPGATSAFLASFPVGASTSVTQVRAYLVDFAGAPGSTVGKTVYGVVLDPTTGAVLGRSADFVVTAASINTFTTLTLNTPVTVASGSFLAGLAQTYQAGQALQYFPLGTQPEVPGRLNTFYTSPITTPATPTDVGVGIAARFMLEAVTAPTVTPTCAPVTALTAGTVTQTGATLTFTAPAVGASSYAVTYSTNGGAVTTVTPAPTASPVVLTGLTPATTYTVSVTTTCGPGQTSPPTIVTFTTGLPSPTYATLPLAQSFEGPWLSLAAVRDAPSNSWRNTPATGDASWRRDDDGASAAWTLATFGGYTPVASQGARSARFHSYGAAAGETGSLDLYVNLSGPAGPRTLTFDYVNTSSATTNPDKLDVLVSTDGGVTFATTPVLTATISATFTARTVVIPSTSATTVIRFRALSDFGITDIGIDNVQLRVGTATRNETLAATVALYPNPASRAFTLSVPAGSLRAASATLSNALGQVVQTRTLDATGTTAFDVSKLAAGVYSLTLKAGNDLVVKRVVVE